MVLDLKRWKPESGRDRNGEPKDLGRRIYDRQHTWAMKKKTLHPVRSEDHEYLYAHGGLWSVSQMQYQPGSALRAANEDIDFSIVFNPSPPICVWEQKCRCVWEW